MSITAGLARNARARPEAPALTCEGETIAYGALDALVRACAGRLAALPAGGVALHLANGLPLAVLFLAAARAGREAQLLDPAWPADLARQVLAHLKPAAVVSADAAIVRSAAAGTFALHLPAMLSVDRLVAALPAAVCDVAEPDEALAFYVGFTSGSTGLPKGYRRLHRSWTASFEADAVEFAIGPSDVVLAPGALTHSLFLYALANGLHCGAHVILARRFRPDTALALARRHGATVVYGVPTQLALLLDAIAAGAPLEGVRLVLSSGAKWFAHEKARLSRLVPGAVFAEFYGASELSFVTVAKGSEEVPEGSVGRPFAGVAITIRDRAGRRLPAGRAGLVHVDSPFLFSGYAMGASDDLLRHGEGMSVGDVGVLDARGFLTLVGRARRMIVTSGKNLYPEEVERQLERHPAIRAAAVLGVSDARRGERLVALLALRGDHRPGRAELIGWLRPHLPLYKIPRLFAVVADWPMTASGKTDFPAVARLWPDRAEPVA